MLSVLLYPRALVLCQLHQLNKKLGGQPQRSSGVSCSNRLTCLCAPGTSDWLRPSDSLLMHVADTE